MGTYTAGRHALVIAVLTVVVLLAPASAAPARTLETVLQDDAQLLHRPEHQLRRSLEELRLLGVNRIRVTAGWSVLTRDADAKQHPIFDARNPAAYEQERWKNLDRLIVLAREYGFKTMVDIAFWAPKWASADAPAERGRTNVDPAAFAEFAQAVARRYSGSFIIPRDAAQSEPVPPIAPSNDERFLAEGYGTVNPETGAPPLHEQFGLGSNPFMRDGDDTLLQDTLGGTGTAATRALPKVEVFTLWNEPNHTGFLRPQWKKVQGQWRPSSPHLYRAMVQAAYPAVKAMRPDAQVLIGGTAFNGTYNKRGTGGVPPLRFLRELACVDRSFKPFKRDGCSAFKPIPGDGWAHHPYSLQTEPGVLNPPTRPDDVPIAELPKLVESIDRLIRMGRVSPALRQLWITEYGYETNPPVTGHKFSPGDQAQFLPWAEYLAWKVPSAQSMAQFLLRDLPPGAFRVGTSKKRAFGEWQSGLIFQDGTHKLGAEAFRLGLVVERVANGRMRLWVRSRLGPGTRTAIIEAKQVGKPWNAVRSVGIGENGRGVTTFPISGDGVVQRFGRSHPNDQRRYHVKFFNGERWETTPPVRAIDVLL